MSGTENITPAFVDYVEVFEGKDGPRVRQMSANGRIINVSEAYSDQFAAMKAAGQVAEQLGVEVRERDEEGED
jgi:uncharacterized protein YegP (UPF0339 family)